MKFRRLRPDEIDCRVGQVTAKGYTLLLYKDARCDMNILDETVGAEDWQRDHKEIKGNLYCGVAIWDEKKSQWVWKWDCGTESNTEKEKGEASDSFKRACFNLGIGRELYTSPFIFVQCETIKRQDGKGYDIPQEHKYLQPRVEEIDYDESGNIIRIIIVDKNNNLMFSFGKKYIKSNLVGGAYIFSSGKYKDKTIEEISQFDNGYLDYLLLNEQVSDNIKSNIRYFRNNGDVSL